MVQNTNVLTVIFSSLLPALSPLDPMVSTALPSPLRFSVTVRDNFSTSMPKKGKIKGLCILAIALKVAQGKAIPNSILLFISRTYGYGFNLSIRAP